MKYSKNKYLLNISDLVKLKEIYIYGTGVSSKKLKDLIEKSNIDIEILGFIDSYKETSISENMKVYNIKDFKDLGKTIIICTYYEEWIDEIIRILDYNNIGNYFINMIILDPMYKLNDEKYKLFKEKILYINEYFQNDIDRRIWDSVIDALKNNLNNTLLFENYYLYGNEQYLDCIKIEESDIIIEGGVFDGITSLKMANYLGAGKLYAFDPLISHEKNELFCNDKIEIIKEALWSENKDLYFINNGAGSYVSENYEENLFLGNFIKVKSITIDSFIENNKLEKFDFLKLDVEGSELNVLIGSINSIKKYRPKLAISIYHSLEDFFNIPFYLMSELEDYNFNIRLYSGALMDTVLYATPKR
jgi:FkbM family methyltransferase